MEFHDISWSDLFLWNYITVVNSASANVSLSFNCKKCISICWTLSYLFLRKEELAVVPLSLQFTYCDRSHTELVTTFPGTNRLNNSMAGVRDSLAEAVSATGKFVRVASGFRDMISVSHPIYKPEHQRYHLYISLACPWANRCSVALKLKGNDTF